MPANRQKNWDSSGRRASRPTGSTKSAKTPEDMILNHNNNNNTTTTAAAAMARAAPGGAVATPPFKAGRSLTSAEWTTNRTPGGGTKRHGAAPLTAGSWTADKEALYSRSVNGSRGARRGSGQYVVGSRGGEEGGGPVRGRRGWGKAWDGLYQIRPFDYETPE